MTVALRDLASLDRADLPAAVEEYAQAGTGRAYSPTVTSRYAIAALRGIGLDRSEFSVRNATNSHGEYRGARFSIRGSSSRRAHQVVADNAELLVACGLSVHVMTLTSGRVHCFGQTSDHPEIYRYDNHGDEQS